MSRFVRKTSGSKESYRFVFNIAKDKHPDVWSTLHALPIGTLSEFVRVALSQMIERKGGTEAIKKMCQGQNSKAFLARLEKTIESNVEAAAVSDPAPQITTAPAPSEPAPHSWPHQKTQPPVTPPAPVATPKPDHSPAHQAEAEQHNPVLDMANQF